jgi:hypothetical protein
VLLQNIERLFGQIDVVGRSLEALINAYLALEAEAARIWLKINEQIT